MLRGFHPCHIGTLDFALCRDRFSGWNVWRPFFGGIYCSYCSKTHTENSGKNSVEKFGENIPFFGALFGTFFGAFFGEQLFCLEIRKIRAESVLQERPLNNMQTQAAEIFLRRSRQDLPIEQAHCSQTEAKFLLSFTNLNILWPGETKNSWGAKFYTPPPRKIPF